MSTRTYSKQRCVRRRDHEYHSGPDPKNNGSTVGLLARAAATFGEAFVPDYDRELAAGLLTTPTHLYRATFSHVPERNMVRLQVRVAKARAIASALIEPLLSAQTNSETARFAWDNETGHLDLQACAQCFGDTHRLADVVEPLFLDAVNVLSGDRLLAEITASTQSFATPFSTWE